MFKNVSSVFKFKDIAIVLRVNKVWFLSWSNSNERRCVLVERWTQIITWRIRILWLLHNNVKHLSLVLPIDRISKTLNFLFEFERYKYKIIKLSFPICCFVIHIHLIYPKRVHMTLCKAYNQVQIGTYSTISEITTQLRCVHELSISHISSCVELSWVFSVLSFSIHIFFAV